MNNVKFANSDIMIMSEFLANKYFHFKDSEEMAWNSVVSWLSRLRLLEGVPFPYIVPSEGMLPNESIRFFHVDRNWLDALVDGYKAFEYKKTHILYNNGGYNEYCLKSLLSPEL